MNWFYLTTTILSFKKELKIVLLAFLIAISLPFIAVFILLHTGINLISDTLVNLDPEIKIIQIKDPGNGEVIKEISPEIVWPVQGVITLEFGQSSSYQPLHTGIDIANANGQVGDPITPFMKGTVVYAGEIFWGYGKHVIIDHGDNITSLYGHLDKIYVFKGQKVDIGHQIGIMGSTGWSTGPHLHFEIRLYGIPVNPRKFLDTSSS